METWDKLGKPDRLDKVDKLDGSDQLDNSIKFDKKVNAKELLLNTKKLVWNTTNQHGISRSF